MNLLLVGASHKTMPIELREKLAFDGAKLPTALNELTTRFGCEAAIITTCNRVEIYVARGAATIAPDAELIAEFVAQFHDLPMEPIRKTLYARVNEDAVRHLFRVASSLESLIVGEGQIAGQVKQAYESAQVAGSAGPVMHPLFQQALSVAKRVRTQTGISKGHVSVSSVAVDYVRQVHDHFGDKTILVIGAGKMGALTLKHLRALQPERILVTNRSPEKALDVARACGGSAIAWEKLDDALVEADIVLSTTGAPEPIMTRRRFDGILARRSRGTMVILDIAVPRDFDPRIHDGDRACVFNVDDLKRIQEQTLQERRVHIKPAETIIEQEVKRFLNDWRRRKHGPIIAQLTQFSEEQRRAVAADLFAKLNGKLSDEDRKYIEGALKLLANRILHGPISALAEETPEPSKHTLLEAMMKLFRLERLMIYVLPKIGTAFRVRQLVRFTVPGYAKPMFAKIAKVVRTKGKSPRYELDHSYLPRVAERRRYSESELEPVLEVFIGRARSAPGFWVSVRNGMAPLRTLGLLAKSGKRWQATPAGAKDPLAESFTSKKAAAMALIDRRRRATRSPNL